jgi:2-polyprenyl-3-methyl-5-hydroxy-6-metoxy-1,4-benzoquinol methylase
MAVDTSLNRAAYEEYLSLRERLAVVRAGTPIEAPGYYPYASLELVPQVIPLLDAHRVDLKECIAGRTVLDLGCGDGDLSFFFERLGAARVIALDWGPTNFNGLRACRALSQALNSRVELRDADAHTVDFSTLPMFDTAACLGFLYHSPHPLWILQNLATRTKDLFLTTKVFDNEAAYAYFYDEAECNNDATNWWCFTPRALRLMLKRVGFRVEMMERLDPHLGVADPVDLSRDGRVFVYARNERL